MSHPERLRASTNASDPNAETAWLMGLKTLVSSRPSSNCVGKAIGYLRCAYRKLNLIVLDR